MKTDADIAGRIGLASILLFGVCVGAAMALFLTGHITTAGWLGPPMIASYCGLLWAKQALENQSHD